MKCILILLFSFTLQAQSLLLLFGEEAATVTPEVTYDTTTTEYKYPNATGEDYNQWNDAAEALTANSNGAYPTVNGNQQDYYVYSFGIPSGAEILGVQASLRYMSYEGAGATSTIGVEITGNGGTTYSATSYQVTTVSTTFVTHTVGSASALWGLTLTDASFSTSNFRIRVTGIAGNDLPTLDYIAVRVTYRTTGE